MCVASEMFARGGCGRSGATSCVVSALLFHADLGDQTQFILFMKNLAMAGGFLFLVAHGAGDWSLDARRDRAGVLA